VSNAVKSSDILATNLSFIMYPYLAKFLVTYKFQQTALSLCVWEIFPHKKDNVLFFYKFYFIKYNSTHRNYAYSSIAQSRWSRYQILQCYCKSVREMESNRSENKIFRVSLIKRTPCSCVRGRCNECKLTASDRGDRIYGRDSRRPPGRGCTTRFPGYDDARLDDP